MADVCSNPDAFNDVGFSADRYSNALAFDDFPPEGSPAADAWIDGSENNLTWVRGLSDGEKESIGYYTHGENYKEINGILREDRWETMTQEQETHILNLESAIDKARASEDVIVYRGAGPEMLNLEPGTVFVDEAFVSTSLDAGTASFFGDGQMVQIVVPKGANIAPLNATGLSHNREYEMLIQAGSRFKAMGPNKDGVMVLMMLR